MTEQRSIRRSRPPIRSAEQAVHADYGAGDLYEFVGIKRGQFQTWLSYGFFKPSRMDHRLRVFGFVALVLATIAKLITQRFTRVSIRRIMEDIANQIADENWHDLAIAKGGKFLEFEILDEDTGDVSESSGTELTVEDAGSPVGILIRVDIATICQQLIARILATEGSPNA